MGRSRHVGAWGSTAWGVGALRLVSLLQNTEDMKARLAPEEENVNASCQAIAVFEVIAESPTAPPRQARGSG